MRGRSRLGATYRLQWHQGFGLREARELVPYLKSLGITHVYASPLFKARRGSLHGYSVTNPLELNPELGPKGSFDRLAQELKGEDMGLILDIVSNHMAMSPANPWWMDVLESGPASAYAPFFDIDWSPPKRTLEGKVLLPVLGKPFGQALEAQELTLKLNPGGFAVHYYDHKFPVAPKVYLDILTLHLDELEQEIGEGNPAFLGLIGIISMLEHLPERTVRSRRKLKERHRDKEIVKERLWLLYQGSPEIKKFLDTNIELFNGTKEDSASHDLMEKLLSRQSYRLAFWRASLEYINYRRFFSINELIGMRQEDPEVFGTVHALLFRLINDGKVSGLRIDHCDGLYDPLDYLLRLREHTRLMNGDASGAQGFSLVVEKILAGDEPLPREWPVCGTTGYDFLRQVNGLFVDKAGFAHLTGLFRRHTGLRSKFSDLVYECKKQAIESLFGGEVESLGDDLSRLSEYDRHALDLPHRDLVLALKEATACLPVYRTYIRGYEIPDRDRGFLEGTLKEARRRHPSLDEAFGFLRRVLLLHFPPLLPENRRERWLSFVMRWQQYTGAIMAKGQEDTALYVYNCLTSLNEVGCDCRPVSPTAFHRFSRARQREWPCTMNATSTHDTKRSEDVRLRISVLSEMPEAWEERLKRWSTLNQEHKRKVQDRLAPDANEEILLYQTMLGAWPLNAAELPAFKRRLQDYMVKAAREAKINTRWISPEEEYERALRDFVTALLDSGPDDPFLADFQEIQGKVAFYGALNSLAQLTLKLAAPGVPDFYQGTELWDFSLVDPDNRRPVDFRRRRNLLQEIKKLERKAPLDLVQSLLSGWQDGQIKLYLTYRGLNFRRDHLELFVEGDYLPLHGSEAPDRQLVAFARRWQKNWVAAVVPRFFSKICPAGTPPLGQDFWKEEFLNLPAEAQGSWTNLFTGEKLAGTAAGRRPQLALAEIFRHLPVALLHGIEE
jgi:(1->4)-alpha-D-glucan 1-alpha-D-glucosylmutase